MSKTTKPNYSATLTYGNMKYVNKDMFMSDNENNEVLEDEITRNKEWNERRMARVERMKALNMPDVLIENELFWANMTYSEAMIYSAKCKEKAEAESKKYCEDNPMKEEYVNLIYKRFDMWFEKYRDNADKLEDELHTGHNFFEPWFWGSIPPGAEKEFYENIFTQKDWENKMYLPVFEVCENQIKKRLSILETT